MSWFTARSIVSSPSTCSCPAARRARSALLQGLLVAVGRLEEQVSALSLDLDAGRGDVTEAIGALSIAAAAAWLAAATVGLGATRRVALIALTRSSPAPAGSAAAACGVLLAVHGAGTTLRLGTRTGRQCDAFTFEPLAVAVHRPARARGDRDRAVRPALPRARPRDRGLPVRLQPRAAWPRSPSWSRATSSCSWSPGSRWRCSAT